MPLLKSFLCYLVLVGLAKASVNLSGDFVPLESTQANRAGSAEDRIWTSEKPGGQGTLSLRLNTVGRTISLLVAGYPNGRDLRFSLKSIDDQRELKLGLRAAPGPFWCEYTWSLPEAWSNQPLILSAHDYSQAEWIGVGLVADKRVAQSARWRGLFTSIGAILLTLLPVFTAAVLLRPRFGNDPPIHIALTLSAAGVFAVLTFFAFFLHARLGFAVILGGWLVGVWAVYHCWREKLGSQLPTAWLVAPLAFSLAMVAITFLYGGAQAGAWIPAGRHDLGLPPDNQLPEFFAERIHLGLPLRPFLADWLTSDRPPLQTGFLLLSRPFFINEVARIAAAISAQLAVYAGLAVVLCAAGVATKWTRLILIACAASGFFVINTLFAWPKLLAAGFLLAIAGLLFRQQREKRAASFAEAVTLGLCAALAMLSHGGSFFGLIALAAVHLLRAGWRDWRLLAVSGTAAFVLFSPWMAYQRFADPPGDRLVKYHLAGRTAIDPRGSLPVIAEAYQQTAAEKIIQNKISNFRVLIGDYSRLFPNLRDAWRAAFSDEWRVAWWRVSNAVQGGAFFHLLQSLGVLSIGLPGLWLGRRRYPELCRVGWYCLLMAMISIFVWCLLMFGPEGTVIHQGTYLTGALFHTACLLGLITYESAWLRRIVLCLHFAVLLGIWVFSPTWQPWELLLRPGVESFWLMVLIVAAVLTGWATTRFRAKKSDASANL